jgi:transcriptional regulator with XRE-family HTH domain
MTNKQYYREVLGERLRAFREDRGLTAYKVAKNGGIRIDQVRAIESGETNYTINIFLGYITGSDLYIYFAEKSEDREPPHDFKDIVEKMRQNDPKL